MARVPRPFVLAAQFGPVKFSRAELRDYVNFCRKKSSETERLTAAGYRKHETDWEIHRGARRGDCIVDAVVSADGLYVWTKIGPRT
jgi:hypothetical protein